MRGTPPPDSISDPPYSKMEVATLPCQSYMVLLLVKFTCKFNNVFKILVVEIVNVCAVSKLEANRYDA